MAFKLRSALYKEGHKLPIANDGSNQFKKYQTDLKKTYMSSKDSGVGAYPDPQTGERTFYDKKHQSYDMKKGVINKTGSFKGGEYVMNKPKPAATKSKSPYPASQGGTPLYNTKPSFREAVSVLTSGTKKKAASDKMKAGNTNYVDINKMRADANAEQQKKIDAKNNKASDSDNNIVKPVSNADRHDALSKKSGRENIDKISKNTNVREKVDKLKKKVNNNKGSKNTNKNTKSSKPTTTLSTGSNTSKDKSGGYLKDTKNFSLGVDTKLNVAPMPRFEKTVTNARSADYDLVRAKGRGRSSRLKTRLEKRQGRVENRVDRSLDKIEARQQRKGTKYAGKMKAAQIKSEKGKIDPGYFESQKKLDTFEKGINSPKATSKTSGAGNISSGSKVPSLRTLESKPKNKKATSASAKRLTPNSKTPELRVLGAKDKKSVNKSSKKATKNIKASTKHLTDIATGNKGNQHNAKAFRDQLKFEKNIKNKKTTTLTSGESFKNTPKKSTKRYMK